MAISVNPSSVQGTTSSGRAKVQAGTRLAAIDVGSNAIRLVIGEVEKSGEIKILKKTREGVRLGKDTFAKGEISNKTLERAVETFQKFKLVLKENGVRSVRAVATSAMREAKNSDAVVSEILKTSGITIEVIDGLEEGRLIFSAVANRMDLSGKRAILIDIGGGSVELTLTESGKIKATESFPLGTVRLIEALEAHGLKEKHLNEVIAQSFRPARAFLKDAIKDKRIDFAIGTGGNFECLGKLRVALLSKSSIHSMTYDELEELTAHLAGMSVKERIRYLRLREDRADVIVPAALVTSTVMKAIPTEILQIPFVGLREGILASLL